MRGRLSILVIATALAVGLWYLFAPSDTPDVTRSDADAPVSRPAPAADDPDTADASTEPAPDTDQTKETAADSTADGARVAEADADADADSTTDIVQTSEPGTTAKADDTLAADSDADSTADVARTSEPDFTPREDDTPIADSGADSTTDVAQTSEPGATTLEDDTLAADSGADSTTEVAQTSEPGATTLEDDTLAADSGTDSTTGAAQTSETVAMAAPEIVPTFGTGPVPSADAAGTTDSDASDAEPRTAAEEADQSTTGEVVLAPATDGTIERTPIAPTGGPPDGETDPEDVLAAVASGIERIRSAIEEQLGIEPGEDTDTALRLRIEYDDAPKDAAQTGLEPKEGAETAAAGGAPADDVAQTTDIDAESPSGDAAPAPDVARTTDTGAESPADPAQAIGSDGTPSTTPLRTADSDGTAPSKVDQTADAGTTGDEGPGAEAKQYVETLTATTPPTIPVDKADHFVTQDSVVSLVPEDSIESTTVGDLADDDALTPQTPITVVREVEQIETAVPEQLIADSGGDLDRTLRIVVKYDDSQQIDEPSSPDEDAAGRSDATPDVIAEDTSAPEADEQRDVEEITVREALERMRTEPGKPLLIVRTVRHFEVMTLRELLDSEEDDGAFLNVVLQPYRIEAATLADLLRLHKTESPDTISYLHTVQPADDQGIWGIVHFGLIANFARGMAVRRGEEIETYTVQIPRDADERLEDRSSSFLGKLIDRKTKESYVYNYRENRMGRNPDTIYPGQEIVIIDFEPGELEAIYEHFADA